MRQVNMLEAKTHLSRLVEQAAMGEDIVIARAGRPVARLTAYHEDQSPRRPGGRWKGKVRMAPDFDAPCPELESLFSGEKAS